MLSGTLYIVATPIGNLGDLSPRAQEVLTEVAIIFAEDTRHSAKLLKAFAIDTPLKSCHEYNEMLQVERVLGFLQQGQDVAVISDAGTPLISDPGFKLVNSAHKANIKVVPIPGPCALIAALSVAGLPTNRFQYEGFLSAKAAARHNHMVSLANVESTLVFYEAPHRIIDFIADAATCFGESRQVVICRELTKHYETIRRGSLSEILNLLKTEKEQCLGEFVVVIAGNDKPHLEAQHKQEMKVLQLLLKELPLKQAVKLSAEITGGHKNALYEQALELKKKQ